MSNWKDRLPSGPVLVRRMLTAYVVITVLVIVVGGVYMYLTTHHAATPTSGTRR